MKKKKKKKIHVYEERYRGSENMKQIWPNGDL
jgi:hypothetical protein